LSPCTAFTLRYSEALSAPHTRYLGSRAGRQEEEGGGRAEWAAMQGWRRGPRGPRTAGHTPHNEKLGICDSQKAAQPAGWPA
jgi:hypothetical protein